MLGDQVGGLVKLGAELGDLLVVTYLLSVNARGLLQDELHGPFDIHGRIVARQKEKPRLASGLRLASKPWRGSIKRDLLRRRLFFFLRFRLFLLHALLEHAADQF